MVRRKEEKEAESLEREMRKVEERYNRAYSKAWKQITKSATAQARKRRINCIQWRKKQPIKASLLEELKRFFVNNPDKFSLS
jgi:hypothetical protein